MSEPIIFYDIPGKRGPWSPNTWIVRYVLNYKGVAYKTEWVEYPDIEALCKKIGAKPTDKKPDGRDHYTLPVIYDPSTKAAVENSIDIIRYLDKTYPNTPPLFPKGTHALQTAFYDAFASTVMLKLFRVVIAQSAQQMNEPSEKYFRATREPIFGKLEDVAPPGEVGEQRWKEAEEAFGKLAEWLDANSKAGETGIFVTGETFTYADALIASRLVWARVVLDAEKWARITSWQGGRWEKLLQAVQKYETVV
ncbi:hypothetical protein K474DRAFT_1639689 [Panus rudis PR-1116 ss-1]|nr:hypothetical protein K474DRAFT_1639689 [Panus rudis PR-1116 ss-1]